MARKRRPPLTRSYSITTGQMSRLWQIYHTLALCSETAPLIEVTAIKLKELLFGIPNSGRCNPKQYMIGDETDLQSLR